MTSTSLGRSDEVTGPPPVPTFFVIGASKAGTTSLHHYLAAHPDIEMTDPKEPHVLCGPEDFRDRLFLYSELLAGRGAIRGEVSPGYATQPFNPEVPDRISAIAPEARLIYLVRDPIERAIAHYAQHVIWRLEDRPIAAALDPSSSTVYLAASRYATQVDAYLRRFPEERLLVVDSDELRERRSDSLRRVFGHVGADPGYWSPEFEVEHYQRSDENTRPPGAQLALRSSALYRRVLRPMLPDRVRRALTLRARRMFGQQVTPEITEELRSRLAELFSPEAERLRALTGERYPTWSV